VFPSLLGELISIGTLLAFAIVCIGVMVLRRRRRMSRAPGYRTAIGGVVSRRAWQGRKICARVFEWLLGFAAYAAYGFRHSLLRSSGT
jgi:APA family basic amino acid/polyamine antiporter